jgi:plastocyanin
MNTSGRSASRARRFVACAIAVVALTALLGACGSSNESDASDAPADAEITIRNFMFEPATLNVKVGTTVTVKNADDTPHTITADDNSFDTGSIAGGESATFTVTDVGTAKYHCGIHNYMTGTIQVTD